MNVSYSQYFNEQLKKIGNKKLIEIIVEIRKNVEQAKSPWEINDLKKLKGYKTAYRIRRGNYRLGIFIEKGEVIFVVIALRKDIYKKFP